MTAKQTGPPSDGDERAVLPATDLADRPVPERILIAPWGHVQSTNGAFVVDDEAASSVADAFAAHGTDLPIDYEHQTLGGRFSSPTGAAPAAGWIKAIESAPQRGLFAQVRWTDEAVEQLGAGQYRYLSPVAIVRKCDRKLVALHSAALTNKPAIVGMTPIVNRRAADGDQDAAIVALREQLALDASCPLETVLAAAAHRLAELEGAERERAAEARVDEAFRAGKLTVAQRDWAMRLALEDHTLFDQWQAVAPVLAPSGRCEPPDTCLTAAPAARRAETAARAEYRANPGLAGVTSEEAYVADARRQSG
jgi:phage I-like protein